MAQKEKTPITAAQPQTSQDLIDTWIPPSLAPNYFYSVRMNLTRNTTEPPRCDFNSEKNF